MKINNIKSLRWGNIEKENKRQDIYGIRDISDDGYIIMNNGTLSAVFEISPVNLSTYSDSEIENIYLVYQQLLKEIDINMKIVIESRLNNLNKSCKYNNSIYARNYFDYLNELICNREMSKKTMYIVVWTEAEDYELMYSRIKTNKIAIERGLCTCLNSVIHIQNGNEIIYILSKSINKVII